MNKPAKFLDNQLVERLFIKHGGPVPNEGWCLNRSGLYDFLHEFVAAQPDHSGDGGAVAIVTETHETRGKPNLYTVCANSQLHIGDRLAATSQAIPIPQDGDERAQFEVALVAYFAETQPDRAYKINVEDISRWRGNRGDYAERPVIRGMWEGWKRRAALASNKAAPYEERAHTFMEVGTTERGSAINAAMQSADQAGFTRGTFKWCSIFADALARHVHLASNKAAAVAVDEPIHQEQIVSGDWRDISEFRYNTLPKSDWKRIVYGTPPTPMAFQSRVQPWMLQCFGAEIAADKIERNHRFFEESTETVQANGMTRSEAHQLVDYVYDRPVGELHQEVGGVMVTLAALCLASGIDMHEAGEVELARVWTKIEKIRAKQAAKPKHSPLPEHTHPAAAQPSRAEVLEAPTLSDDELALIGEEAATITDDWSERQLIEPTRKESDAKFVREILRLAGDKP